MFLKLILCVGLILQVFSVPTGSNSANYIRARRSADPHLKKHLGLLILPIQPILYGGGSGGGYPVHSNGGYGNNYAQAQSYAQAQGGHSGYIGGQPGYIGGQPFYTGGGGSQAHAESFANSHAQSYGFGPFSATFSQAQAYSGASA